MKLEKNTLKMRSKSYKIMYCSTFNSKIYYVLKQMSFISSIDLNGTLRMTHMVFPAAKFWIVLLLEKVGNLKWDASSISSFQLFFYSLKNQLKYGGKKPPNYGYLRLRTMVGQTWVTIWPGCWLMGS